MTDAEPNIPPGEETRESGTPQVLKPVDLDAERGKSHEGLKVGGSEGANTNPAADRLLPPFLLVQQWEPDVYDEVVLDWWGEAYLMECGTLHADARLAEHDHGRILALVVVEEEDQEEAFEEDQKNEALAEEQEKDWVEECREIAGQ